MKHIYFLTTVIAVTLAAPKPEPQLGYDYRRPSPQIPTGSYGTPQVGGGTTGFQQGGVIGTGTIGGIGGGIGGTIGGISGGTGGSFGSTGGSFGTGGGAVTNFQEIGGGVGGISFGTGGVQNVGGGVGGGSFGTSGVQNIGGGVGGGSFGTTSFGTGGVSGGAVGIQRHVYVYTAPEEKEVRTTQQISAGQAQKHYKIIFIKTPAPPSYSAPQIQALAQNQEKTLIYVLVKRPEDIGDITIPTAAPTQPSKPEVYFIRYKSQKQAQTGTVGTVGTTGTADLGIQTGSKTDFSTTGTGFTGTSVTSVSSKYGPPGQSGPY